MQSRKAKSSCCYKSVLRASCLEKIREEEVEEKRERKKVGAAPFSFQLNRVKAVRAGGSCCKKSENQGTKLQNEVRRKTGGAAAASGWVRG